jgi:O-antigen ligase
MTAVAIALLLLALPLCFWTLLTPARWLVLFLFTAMLLPPLPLLIGDSGPHPALLFAALGVLAGLLRLGEWRFQADLLNLALCAFWSVLLGSIVPAAIYSGVPIAAASLARVGLFGISVYVFLYARDGPAAGQPNGEFALVRWLFLGAVAAALFACLDFYFQIPAPAGFGPQFVWLDSGVFRRAQGLFYEASTLGNFCAFFLVMIGVSLVRPKQERPVHVGVLVAGGAVLATALVLSYSRASLLNLVAASLALLFLRRSKLRLGRLAILTALVLITVTLVMVTVFPAFVRPYWLRLSTSASFFLEAPNQVLSGRLGAWRFLLDFLLDHPWHLIFGVGYKTLPYSSFIGRTVIADNMYLSLLVETGVPGLATVLLLCGTALGASLQAARSEDPRRSFFGGWFFCFWTGQMVQMLSGDLLTYWRVMPLYFWTLAVATRGSPRP